MILHLRSHSFRYAVALWLASITALFIAYFLQLEPAQWAAITVWIMFMQDPRLNYSKVIWWAFGTVVGAAMAVFLTVCFNQAPELFLFFLSLWLAVCSGIAKLVTSYRSYGWVLAGYTCCIVSMSGAVDHPDNIFRVAITRVSCIFIGMACAIMWIKIMLPRHRHWSETLRHLGEHLKASLFQAAKALDSSSSELPQFTWRHMADRLSALEHTLDITTAESPDARIHSPQARSLVATLFDLLAKAQAIEVHLSRPEAADARVKLAPILSRTKTLLAAFAKDVSPEQAKETSAPTRDAIVLLREEISDARREVPSPSMQQAVSTRFVLDRLVEMLEEFDRAIQDWSGLFGPWTARRDSRLSTHQDYQSAFIFGLRMFLAMTSASVLWFITQWPSGPTFILFMGVVCSLLSLVEYAPDMGTPFLKSAVACAIIAYFEAFWLFQKGDTFISLALMLALFLIPAGYAYRHPRLLGGAVVSMLIFYGLSNPSNQMNYDISAFVNNGLGLLCAVAWSYFAFHAVPSMSPKTKRFWLLRTTRAELSQQYSGTTLSEQSWTSRMFDRLRLLHRSAKSTNDVLDEENEMLVSLQLGLRQRRLTTLSKTLSPHDANIVTGVFHEFRKIGSHPNIVALCLRSACIQFEETASSRLGTSESLMSALAEMWEMTFLIETSSRLYRA
jgi:uncharacterized membrane protein YccC